jgi:hypothetical protein
MYFERVRQDAMPGEEDHTGISLNERLKIRKNSYGWNDNSLLFRCRLGVWDERVNFKESERHKLIVETDRGVKEGNACIFLPVHTPILPPSIITRPKAHISLDQKTQAPKALTEVERETTRKKIKLGSRKISFDNACAIIKFGKQEIKLPQDRNEHCLCRVMFKIKVKTSPHWDTVYKKAMGQDPTGADGQEWRKLYDAMTTVNNRIKTAFHTDDNLFTWRDSSIKRNF